MWLIMRYMFVVFASILLVACEWQQDSVDHDGDNLNVSFMRPTALGDPLIPGLRAEVNLDGRRTVELSVSEVDNTISGQINNVVPGDHVLVIHYFVVLGEVVTLATVTTNVAVASGQVSEIIITDADLNRDFDNDADGFTNLVEVRSGTDPNDITDFPL